QGTAAPHLDVNPTPELLSLERHLDRHLVVAFGFVDTDDDLAMHIRTHRHGRAEHRFVQRAIGGEDGVTDNFGIDALDRFAPVEPAFRITQLAPWITPWGLA